MSHDPRLQFFPDFTFSPKPNTSFMGRPLDTSEIIEAMQLLQGGILPVEVFKEVIGREPSKRGGFGHKHKDHRP